MSYRLSVPTDQFEIDLDDLYPKPTATEAGASVAPDLQPIHRREKVSRSWQSVQIRADFCKYHYCEFKETFDCLVTARKQNPTIDVNGSTFMLELKLRAHVLAFMQCLHAICDTIGVVIWYCLAEKLKKNIYLKDIEKWSLSQKNGELSIYLSPTDPGKVSIVESVKKIIDSPEFTYLDAYVNQAKHNELVDLWLKTCDRRGAVSVKFEQFLRVDASNKTISPTPIPGECEELFDVPSFMERAHGMLLPTVVDIQTMIKDCVHAMALEKKRRETAADVLADNDAPAESH